MSELEQKALTLAESLHTGQVDRAGVDYMVHIRTVHANTVRLGGCEVACVAALLHDSVEDCEITNEEVAELFGSEVARVVGLVTKVAGQKKKAYMRGIKACPIATLVKLADMEHNSQLSRLTDAGLEITEADERRNAEYLRWMEYLRG